TTRRVAQGTASKRVVAAAQGLAGVPACTVAGFLPCRPDARRAMPFPSAPAPPAGRPKLFAWGTLPTEMRCRLREGPPVFRCRLLITVLLPAALVPGCTAARPRGAAVESVPAASWKVDPSSAMVFVADGSGDLRQVADGLTNVAQETKAPLRVQRVQWSHGKGAIFKDLYDADHHRAEGKALAQQVVAYREAHPYQRICLVGYSSGASIVLAAAEQMPPDTMDRMVLLSPTVAARHDLRPSLRSCREGIDAFHSEWDAVCLVLYAMGTGDGAAQPVAGRSGFVPVSDAPQDVRLYQGLRQHFWPG